MQITYRYDKNDYMYNSKYWKSSDYRWPMTKKIGGADKVLIYCEINRRFNQNDISNDWYEKLEYTIKLNEKDNGNH